jgi:hypothetical protein
MIQFLWSWATPRQETYLAQTHFRKTETTRNHSHQNVLVIRTKVKPLYKQQTSHILTIHTIYNTQYSNQSWLTDKTLASASTSNIEILEHFQSKSFRMIVDAPWYVLNTGIRRDLQIPTVKEEIRRYSSQYSARLGTHTNNLIVNLIELQDNTRLLRHLPNDLSTRFLV